MGTVSITADLSCRIPVHPAEISITSVVPAPDQCPVAAGPWHGSGHEGLGSECLFEFKKQANKKGSGDLLGSSQAREELFTESRTL